jgi:nicotinate-nucleotide adenylyltransferase
MRVGVMGGTFDPVHFGHLILAEQARVQLELDKVIFMTAGQPWLREEQLLTPAKQRQEMVRLAIGSNPSFVASRQEVDRSGPTYTVDTLEEIRRDLGPDATIYFIVGLDALDQFHRWKDPERILGLCHLAAVRRLGWLEFDMEGFVARYPQAAGKVELLSMPLVDISGTELRRRAAAGQSLRYLVPDAVAEYIQRGQLYQSGTGIVEGSPGDTGGGSRDVAAALLKLALALGALKYGEFTLTSGRTSNYYFDGRLLSLDPEGAHLIGRALLPILRNAGINAVGGPALGAVPMVTAVALASRKELAPLPAFVVRTGTRTHGTAQTIEGPLAKGSHVGIIDDTCTTGGSLLHSIAAAEAAECTVVKVVAILDRREGGADELERRGYDFTALLEATPEGNVVVSATI